MSTLDQSPTSNVDQPSSLAISKYNEDFISLVEKVTSKLQSLDSTNISTSDAKVKLAQDSMKICYELLVRVDDALKIQLGSLNGVPEQIDVTSQESIGPLSIDGGVEEIPPFQHRQNTTTHRPRRYNIIQPIQQKLLYIGNNTVNAIKEEVLALGLPATLANISLAIQSSEKVLDAFVNHTYGILPLKDIQEEEERQAIRKDEFRSVCCLLVTGGTTVTLNSWEDVEEKLAEVFLFFRTYYIPMLTPLNRQASKAQRPLLPMKIHHLNQRRGSTTNEALSLSTYKEMMKNKMGARRFERIFNQTSLMPLANFDAYNLS